MGKRNLLTSAVDYLATASELRVAHLVRFDIPTPGGPVPAYLTDYHSDVEWDNKTYQAGKITKIGNVRQVQGLTNYKVSIDVAGEYQEELDRGLVSNANLSYIGNSIEVLRAYLDGSGSIIPFDKDTEGPMKLFIGDITDIEISEGVTSGISKVTWQCAGKFQDFDLVNGRITDDISHRGVVLEEGVEVSSDGAKRDAHQTDTGFQHANQTINIITKYTTQELRYKMQSRYFWQTDEMVEYEVDVVNELELGVDLSAKFLPKIYGVQKTAGIPVFIDAELNDPTQVYVVYAFSEGEIEGFLNFHINGKSVMCNSEQDKDDRVCLGNKANGDTVAAFKSTDSGYSDLVDELPIRRGGRRSSNIPLPYIEPTEVVDHSVGTSQGDHFSIANETGNKHLWVFHGTPNQEANSKLVEIASGGRFLNQKKWAEDKYGDGWGNLSDIQKNSYWDASCKLLDTSYIVMLFGITEEETTVPTLDGIVSGELVSTFDSVGTETSDQYSLNPVWQLRDYMVDTISGGSVDPILIDLPSFSKVAATLDVITDSYPDYYLTYWRYVGWKNTGTGVNRTLMQCNTLFRTETTVTKNIAKILKQFDGTLNIIGNKYYLSSENGDATISDIDIRDIKGSVKTKDLSNKNKWNSVQASIVDPGQGWGTNQVSFFSKEFLTQDNRIKKKGNISFNYITNYYTAREWAERSLNKSRFSREVSFTTSVKYLHLQPNDNVTFTYSRFNYDKKVFRVKAITLDSNGATVNITLEDFDQSIYLASDSIDVSGESTPTTTNALPPTGLEYVPLPDARFPTLIADSLEPNVHGILIWIAPSTTDILRYEVRDWLDLDPNYTVPSSTTIEDSGVEKNFILVTDLVSLQSYSFKVLSITTKGSISKYAVINYTNIITAPVLFSPITGFKASNVRLDGTFDGSVLSLIWDEFSHPAATDYVLEFWDIAGTTIYGTVNIVGLTNNTYEFTNVVNKAFYDDNNPGVLGAYRQFKIKIRVTNGLLVTDPNYRSSNEVELI